MININNKKIIKVSIYHKNTPKNEVLTRNGDEILDSIVLDYETNENLFTGDYTLDLTTIIDKKGLHNYLQEEAILKVKVDYGDEIFRISKINKSDRDIKVFARQITIEETLNMWLVDVRPTSTNGQGALNTLKKNSIGKKDVEFFSDIATINTAYYMDMSVYEALHNCDQSFLNRWGGEIIRRGYTLTINKRIGADRGVQIRSGKNLIGFESKTDIDKVVTRIVAKGYDGIRAQRFIDSPLISKYSSIKTKEIKYDFVKVKNENNPDEGFNTLEEAQVELERLAKLEFSENHIDEIRADYNINYIQLEKTEEYKNFIQSERSFIGDTVNVFEDKHNINIHVRCFNKKYDGMKQKTISMQLTNTDIKQQTITTSDILAEIQSIVKSTDNNSVADIMQSMINSGINDSYVIPRQNEIVIADNKDLDLATNVCRLNKNGLGFSQTGYSGTYEYGFTIDGVINASLITTGILSAILIQNMDGSFQIDLSGEDGALFKHKGKDAIRIHNNSLDLYNWGKNGDFIGALLALAQTEEDGTSNSDKPLIGLVNDIDSALSIGYKVGKSYNSYLKCDKYNILKDEIGKAIRIFEETDFKNNRLYRAILSSLNKKNYIDVTDDKISISFGNKNYLVLSENDISIGQKDAYIIIRDGKITINGPVHFTGNVSGLPGNGGSSEGGGDISSQQQAVVNSARKLIGKPYVWGGNYNPLGGDSGTDCSGLMQWSYNDIGIKISRTTSTQINEGVEVSENNLQLGDLIFPESSHVFMYSGEKDDKHMCVEAPHTGLDIRERSFTWTSGTRARRILKASDTNGVAGSKASANILYYIKGIEGFAPNYYSDEVGVRTLGYGMTGSELNGVSTPLSETTGTKYLANYLNNNYYSKVLSIVKSRGVSNPKQREIDAFASFAYNLGVGAFSSSTLLDKYSAGERGESIHQEFKKWVHAGGQVLNGLVRRREEEWNIFSGSSTKVGGWNCPPSISIIGGRGTVTDNNGYGASPY